MLLLHQAGAVKVGEVVRYTVTYTPSADRILPSPSHLHVKIKNTSSIPLRAAYLHGPYTLHVSAYPSTFSPNTKFESPVEHGVPVFEPNLKAGGHWSPKLVIPESIRESGEKANTKRNIDGSPRTVTWIIEIASQILFSNTASVHYELLVARDRRSLEMGFAAVASKGHGEPGQIHDFKQRESQSPSKQTQPKGVYSRAITMIVEDTAALWDKPALPKWDTESSRKEPLPNQTTGSATNKGNDGGTKPRRKKKKVHLVILTHGLHSNIGADLLYMKESIDAAARLVQDVKNEQRRAARKKRDAEKPPPSKAETSHSKRAGSSAAKRDTAADDTEEDDSDDEQVIVRGFPGNHVRTERGIQYLGKRLAKYVLTLTYPDQPFLPISKSITKSIAGSFSNATSKFSGSSKPSHSGSTVHEMTPQRDDLAYTFTGISFIGHSLGGLVQTYAIAYIHKHSPNFFNTIKPINFVALATPFLGLSNENPLYVKFALDFGLVGRTGQDLGLTWRAPIVARTGWSAMISGLGSNGSEKEPQQEDPGTKPLLRILPSGPAHQVLKKFRNRTVYSNVVNDGIVPLRTSCLLFLDWRGLGKVENARRENGLIGTMAAFGWAELTGANSTSQRPATARPEDDEESDDEFRRRRTSTQSNSKRGFSLPGSPIGRRNPSEAQEPLDRQFLSPEAAEQNRRRESGSTVPNVPEGEDADNGVWKAYTLPNNPLTDFINLFRPSPGKSQSSQPRKLSTKAAKTYKRAQTIKHDQEDQDEETEPISNETQDQSDSNSERKSRVTRGDSLKGDSNSAPPPKTSIFDAAGDILNPPLPPESWIIDPSQRDRTIFHDRIYHPDDIPPPPARKPRLPRSVSSDGSLNASARSQSVGDLTAESSSGGMKVEEKIARAYHHGMPWRKVLVRLEPDAHNNMIVRRMFANAYGWDVVKHMCDTHFANTFSANTRDEDESNVDRANPLSYDVTTDGEEVKGQTSTRKLRSTSELREESDQLVGLEVGQEARGSLTSSVTHPSLRTSRSQDSAVWNDSILDDNADDADDSDDEAIGPFETFQRFWNRSPKPEGAKSPEPNAGAHDAKLAVHTQQLQNEKDKQASNQAQIADAITMSPEKIEMHRGLGTTNPGADIRSTAETDTIEPLTAEEARPSELVQSPTSIKTTSDLGLQKPPEAHISAASLNSSLKGDAGAAASVTEQVARASMSSKDGGP